MHTGFVADFLCIEIHKSRLGFKLDRTVCTIPLKLMQGSQIFCALWNQNVLLCDRPLSARWHLGRAPQVLGRKMLYMRRWRRGSKLSCFCSCSLSVVHFFPWTVRSLFAGSLWAPTILSPTAEPGTGCALAAAPAEQEGCTSHRFHAPCKEELPLFTCPLP